MTEETLRYIDAHKLKTWIHDDVELALLDVREHGQYGENHLFFAVPLPYSILELEVRRLVPRLGTRIVVYADNTSEDAVIGAASALARLGYGNVHILYGGIEAWMRLGYTTFAGVNVPSKTFGELVEHVYDTPSVSADELYRMLNDKSENIVVLDGRPVHEYRKMNIPGAICCPNGELALRVDEIVSDPATTIVVNCAGRTRSIIGAQTLINLNTTNKVYALENGTQGWYLADYHLEHGSNRLYPKEVNTHSLTTSRERATRLAHKFEIPFVSSNQVKMWLAGDGRNVFLCDVRTKEEYQQDNLPTIVQHTPGGQLIQATDKYIGVRKSKIVLLDSDGIRAPVVASWIKQLGWEVYLLTDTFGLSNLPEPPAISVPLQHTEVLKQDVLAEFIKNRPHIHILDARPSQEFRKISIEGAEWVIRPTLLDVVEGVKKKEPILLLGTDQGKLELLALDLEQESFVNVFLMIVDATSLKASGLPVRIEGNVLSDAECIDYLFFVHDRHEGNKEASRKYLEWERGLVPKLDEQERNNFYLKDRQNNLDY